MADHEINQDLAQAEPRSPNEINTEPLRNASPLPESDSDSDSDQEEHTGPHLMVRHHENAWETTQKIGFQALIWLQFAWTTVRFLAQKGKIIGKGVLRSLQPKEYVFFQGSNYPYRAQDYTLSGPGVAPIEWFYDADKKLFISAQVYETTTEYDTRHIEWLSAEIKYNDLTLYDITDYIEEVKYAGATKPSAARVLAAWSLESGIVLNAKEGISLHTLNEDGSESQLTLCG